MDSFHKSQAYLNETKNHFKIQIANEHYIKRLAWSSLFGLILYSFHLLDNCPKEVSPDKAYLALQIVWLGFLPSIQYLFDRNRPPIPFFPLVGIFYANGYGIPFFSTSNAEGLDPLSLKRVSDEALFLVMLGLLGMNIAFYISKFSLLRNVATLQFFESYSPAKFIAVLRLFLLSHIAFIYIPFIQKIPSAPNILDPIGFIAYGMFYIIWSRGQLASIPLKLLIVICFSLEIIKRLASGSLANIVNLGVFMVLIIWCERKRIPIILISILILFLMAFNPIKFEYRALTWGGPYSESSPIEKAQLFINIAVKHYFSSDNTLQKEDTDDSSSGTTRTAQINLFSKVFEDTPKRVPYWGGYTYSNLFTSFIPRALWPDKPMGIIGNVFGRRYGYLGSDDYSTSYNLPWIVEMYVNFGDLGVLIGMPLVGLLLAFLDQKLNSPSMGSMQAVIGATILSGLYYQESNFSLMIGGVIPVVITLYIMFRYLLGSKPQSTEKYEK